MNGRAGVIWLERDPAQAVVALERAAKLSPKTPGVFYRLGLARERTGDASEPATSPEPRSRFGRLCDCNQNGQKRKRRSAVSRRREWTLAAPSLHRVFMESVIDLLGDRASFRFDDCRG